MRLATPVTLGKSMPPVAGLIVPGGTDMVAYRVYCLDGASRFLRAEWVEAGSDEVAIEQAQKLMGDCPIAEVWLRDRRIGRIGHQGSTADDPGSPKDE